MAEEDLNLSDALTSSVPQPGVESTVEKDFVAQLEAETFDDQVMETVEKSDYVPLLDNDDTRPGIALENGEQEAHGVQKSGFSQSEGMGVNMLVGDAPLQVEKASNISDLQHPTLPAVACTPQEYSSTLPESQAPHIPLDLTEGALGECQSNQPGSLSTDPLFMPSFSMGFAKQPGHIAASPENPLYSCHSHESAVYAEVDERDVDGSDQKQKKKKKRRQKDGGSYEHLEFRGQLEMEENTSPSEGFYHRIDPRRDKGGGGWDDQLGRNRGRGKRGKSRKKLPEEWGVTAESFIPTSKATSQITEDVVINQGDLNQNPYKKEVHSEEGSSSQHLSEDFFPTTVGGISPLALGSELKATAAPFTLPSPTKTTTRGSFPIAPSSSDSFDILIDPEDASLGHTEQPFYSPSFSKTKEASGNIVDPTSLYLESSIQDMSESDTSAFSSASKTSLGHSPPVDVFASGPHLSFSDASWQESFDFSNIVPPGQSLPSGLSFNTPSPAPLRSPKTTAPEFQPKHKNAVEKQSQKSPVLCSPSSVMSSTPPEAKTSPQSSDVIAPPSPQSVSTLSVSGSGLNPTAKPFFPSFADPMEYLDVMPEVVPIMKVKSNNMEETEKEEKRLGEMKKEKESLKETEKKEESMEETEKKEERMKETEKKEERMEETEKKEERMEETEKKEERMEETEKKEERMDETEKKEESMDETEKKEESMDETEKKEESMDETEKKEERMEEADKKEERMEEADKKEERMEEAEKEEERKEDSVVKLKPFDTLDKVEQNSVKVECTEQQTVAKGEKEVDDKEKVKDQAAEKVKKAQHTDKEAEKPAEKIDLKIGTENVKEKETKKVELIHQAKREEDKKLKEEELFAKEDKTKKAGDVEMIDKVEDKDKMEMTKNNEEPKVEETKAGNVEEVDQNEKFKLEETKVETKISEEGEKVVDINENEKEQKTEVEAGDKHHIDNMETKLEQQPSLVKNDAIHDKMEKKPHLEKQATTEVKDTENVKVATNQTKAVVKANEVGGPPKRPVNKGALKVKQEKQDKMPIEKKDDKKKMEVNANGERAKIPARPAARSSTTASKEPTGADKKTKPATGVPRPGSITKSRPNTMAAGGSATATTKCAAPLVTTSTKDKKTTPRVPVTTTTTGLSRKLPPTSTSRSSSQPSTTTTTHAVKTKTVPEKNPLMPKASSGTTNQTIKNGPANRAATHTASSMRTTSSTVTTSNAAIKRPLGTRTDSKPEERKQVSTLKTSTAYSSRPKPATTTTRSTTSAASRIQTTAAKPVSTEKKLLVPHNPRPTTSATSTTTTNASKPTGRPSTAPATSNSSVRSKIGSTSNTKQPIGAKVQPLSKKADVSKLTSKNVSKNGIKDKPAGGGMVKTESHKMNLKEKTQPKVASEDIVSHPASGEDLKTEGTQKTIEESRILSSGNPVPDPDPSPTQTESPAAQENGTSKGVPRDSEGLLEHQPLDSHILETSI